jgi:RNA polymerase sigma-70 factor (ECF subfamily)
MASNPPADTLDQLYRAHAPSVFRRARALLADDADAQRVVSDVFGLLYDRPERYSGRPALSRQLYALTTRACFNRLRSRKLQAKTRPAADDEQADSAATLRSLLDRLQEPLDQLAVYYYLDELTQEEVTELLGCSRRRITNLLAQLERSARDREPSR